MTARETGPILPLEQSCVRPGHWLIEGYDVERLVLHKGRRVRGQWIIRHFGEEKAVVTGLAAARDWIRQEKENQADPI